MIILGVVLLIIGFIAKIPIIWTLGIIAVVVGRGIGAAGYCRSRGRRPTSLLLGIPCRPRRNGTQPSAAT